MLIKKKKTRVFKFLTLVITNFMCRFNFNICHVSISEKFSQQPLIIIIISKKKKKNFSILKAEVSCGFKECPAGSFNSLLAVKTHGIYCLKNFETCCTKKSNRKAECFGKY